MARKLKMMENEKHYPLYRCKTFLENINGKQALAFGLTATGRRFFISSGNFAEWTFKTGYS